MTARTCFWAPILGLIAVSVIDFLAAPAEAGMLDELKKSMGNVGKELEKGIEKSLENSLEKSLSPSPAPAKPKPEKQAETAPQKLNESQDGPWTFGDWGLTVVVDPDSKRRVCFATTGDGEENWLEMSYETGAEFAYPDLLYRHIEMKERHEPLLAGGENVAFRFPDGGKQFGTSRENFIELADGEHFAADVPFNNPERAMSWMAAANPKTMTVARESDGFELYRVSLKGFRKTYRKLAELCGADTAGIL